MAVQTPLDWTRAGSMPGGAATRPQLFFSPPRPNGGLPVPTPPAASAGVNAAKAVGRVALPVYLGAQALKTAGTGTEDYARGMGIGQEHVGQSLGKDLAIRAAGAAADLIPGATTAIRYLNTGNPAEIPVEQRKAPQVAAAPVPENPGNYPTNDNYADPEVQKSARIRLDQMALQDSLKGLQGLERAQTQARGMEAGNVVNWDEQGNMSITRAEQPKRTAEGVLDTEGIGGNVYQRQLENMQNMRLRSDMMDQIDTMQRDYNNGPSGIGDIPRWQASAQTLNNLMKQSGPGGMMDVQQAQNAGNVDTARVKGQYGMQIQDLANLGGLEQERVKAEGDVQKQKVASDATLQAKQAELLQKAPEAQQQLYKTLLMQAAMNGEMSFEDVNDKIAALGGTAKNDVYQTNLDELTGTLALTNKNKGGTPQVYTKDQLAELARIQQLRGRQ